MKHLRNKLHESVSMDKRDNVQTQIEKHKQAIRDLKQRMPRSGHLKSGLTHQQEIIIKAALKVLDKEGIDGVSLRKLASLLDIQAPALYWHFKNKTLLIDYMAEMILQKAFVKLSSRTADDPWQDWLTGICKQLRKAMLSHRDGARIIAGAHLFPTVTLLKIMETALESLDTAGVDERKARIIILTAIHFTFGRVIEEQSNPRPEEFKHVDMDFHFKGFPRAARAAQIMMKNLESGKDDFEDSLRLIIGYAKK